MKKQYLYNPVDNIRDELKKLCKNKFRYKNILGRGSFGIVLHADYIDDNNNTETSYAVKLIAKSSITKISDIVEEVAILKMLNHPFVIKLEGTFQTVNQLCIVTEALLYGDLYMCIYDNDNTQVIPTDLIMFYISSIIIVFDYIHSHGIIYRDLKPENIMLDANGYIKLIDMGLAKRTRYVNEYTDDNKETVKQLVDEKTYTLCGSAEYLSPEMLLKTGYDKSVDIWTIGILLYELFAKQTPFMENSMRKLFKNILDTMRQEFIIPEYVKNIIQNESIEKLLIELLQGKPGNRLGTQDRAIDIFKHEAFQNKTETIFSIIGRTYVPAHIPQKIADEQWGLLSTLPAIKPYTGDNAIFANF